MTAIVNDDAALAYLIQFGSAPQDLDIELIDESTRLPPWRVYIDRKSATACLHIHHSLYDGQTLTKLLTDVYCRSLLAH